MSDKPPAEQPFGSSEAGSGNVSSMDQALWGRLSSARSAEELCSSWLALQARFIDGVVSGLVLLRATDDTPLAPVSSWPDRSAASDELVDLSRRVADERRGIVTRGRLAASTDTSDEPPFLVGYPVMAGRGVQGVAVLALSHRSQDALHDAMRQLQWGISWLLNWVLRRDVTAGDHDPARLEAALELTALVLEQDGFHDAATALVTEAATRLSCDRVSIGFKQARNKLKVRALSHSAQFGKQMNLIRSIGLAMSESTDQNDLLVWPQPDGKGGQVLQAHGQLVKAHGSGAVCTAPFGDRDGQPYGAMTFERSVDAPFDEDEVEMCDVIAAIAGPILEEKRHNDRWLIAKVGHSIATQFKKLIGPRHMIRKFVAAGLVVLVAFFAVATGRYRVTAEAVLEGEVRRVVAAPYRGFIRSADVRAGDVVREGQPMCALDERDLRLEYSRWSSEREQYAVEHRQALAEGDMAQANVLTKKMGQAEAQLALLDEQLRRSRILAPFDGVVVSGDLSQSLGAPVETGQVLFEVTPLEKYRLMLQVDEREIGEIQVGQKGELVLTSMPEARHAFVVTRITPVSNSEEGRNLFSVEASLEAVSERLRPGMEGFGKVEIDRRRLIWIWSHELVDWVRLKLWTWF